MERVEFFKKTLLNEEVDVFITNGFRVHGTVLKVLDDVLIVHDEKGFKCIMFEAISTIVPMDSVQFEKNLE